jgi:hypothetical protein
MLVCVHAAHAQAFPLLAGDVGEQAFHPPGGAGRRSREKDQRWGRRLAHQRSFHRSAAKRN